MVDYPPNISYEQKNIKVMKKEIVNRINLNNS